MLNKFACRAHTFLPPAPERAICRQAVFAPPAGLGVRRSLRGDKRAAVKSGGAFSVKQSLLKFRSLLLARLLRCAPRASPGFSRH